MFFFKNTSYYKITAILTLYWTINVQSLQHCACCMDFSGMCRIAHWFLVVLVVNRALNNSVFSDYPHVHVRVHETLPLPLMIIHVHISSRTCTQIHFQIHVHVRSFVAIVIVNARHDFQLKQHSVCMNDVRTLTTFVSSSIDATQIYLSV